jgi:hypothetical protein
MKDYKYTYQNNCFNAKLSNLLDKKRTIIDIDCLLYKIGCKTKIMFDHKKSTDKTSIASLRAYSLFATKEFYCYIVINDLDEKGDILNNKTKIYEIKPFNEVKNKFEKSNYIKDFFILCNDEEVKNFFSVENHLQYKQKIKQQQFLF